jgi:hypothetical protein
MKNKIHRCTLSCCFLETGVSSFPGRRRGRVRGLGRRALLGHHRSPCCTRCPCCCCAYGLRGVDRTTTAAVVILELVVSAAGATHLFFSVACAPRAFATCDTRCRRRRRCWRQFLDRVKCHIGIDVAVGMERVNVLPSPHGLLDPVPVVAVAADELNSI